MNNSPLSYTAKGGHILHWQPADQPIPVLFCSALADIEGPKAIRGGIPVCWPWFGPKEGKPQHGCVRTREWTVVSDQMTGGVRYVELALTDAGNAETYGYQGWKLTLKIEAGTTLRILLTTQNEGRNSISITQALHTYFLIGNIEASLLEGLDGKSYIDKTQNENVFLHEGLLDIKQETDRVYLDTREVQIRDEQNQRVIAIKSEKATAMVVWNPWTEKCKSIPDLEDKDYKRFVCVEAANFPEPVLIEPGQQFTLDMEIEVRSL